MTRRLLVVDDAPDLRAVARLSLERVGGWQVLEAASGADAVELAAAERPDAVLLDVHMPRLDGPATFALLAGDPRTSGIPVVLLTARAEEGDREQWLASGVRGVLTKPFDPVRLTEQVAELLGWTA